MLCKGIQKVGGSEPVEMKVLKADCNIDYVQVDLNQIYAEKDGITLRLQILTPKTEQKKYPLMIFVQGSGWGKQDNTSSKSPIGMLLGGYPLDERLELARIASPVNYIEQEKEVRPILIMHGDKDEIVPFEQSVQFYEKMKACGKAVQFYAGKFIYRHVCGILMKNNRRNKTGGTAL